MDILIADDEHLARARLVRMCEKIESVENIFEAENADDAMKSIIQHDPDLVLLDIRMPGKDGLILAHEISCMDDPPAIVFCTAFENHAIEAFGTAAVGYLLKPIKAEHLLQVLEKTQKLNKIQRSVVQSKQNNRLQRQHVNTKNHRGMELIAIKDIRYFVADQKYVTVYHVNGVHLLDETLKELQDEFADTFVRIHRNALVSQKHIEALERDAQGQFYLRISGVDGRPQVSRRHVGDIKELLKNL